MDVFTALADPVRRRLLTQLVAGPARVVDLAAAHPISRPAVSKHLRLLSEAGLVDGEDHGRERHYRLVPDALAPVRALLTELAPVPAPNPPIPADALDGLDLEVRRTGRERRSSSIVPATPDRQETA